MYKLFDKIKRCRMSLVEWSRTLGNSKALLDDKYNELKLLMGMNNPENLPLIQKV